MRYQAVLSMLAGAVALAWGCDDPRRVPAAPPSVGGAGREEPTATPPASGEPLCGGSGEACCTGALLPCNVALTCDATSSVCIPEDTGGAERLCAREDDCGAGQRCCSSGFVGTCQPLDGSECLLPDLAIYPYGGPVVRDLAPPGLGVYGVSEGYECAVEKQCVNGPGPRRVLRASLQVANVGAADMVFGAPGASPGVKRAGCNGRSYLEGFLRFELLDTSGAIVARTEGRVALECAADGAPYDCEFLGLPRNVSALYVGFGECEWVDITGIPAGDYRLRVRVNPDRITSEANYANNVFEYPVTLPTFDPLLPCTPLDDSLWSRYIGEEWCGWALAASDTGLGCVPGEPVVLRCPSCTGYPLLRVCDGSGTCSSGEALVAGSGGFLEEDRCPTVALECPASGRFSVMTRPDFDGTEYSCPISVGAAPDAGTP
jgi:Lysyl oxidase